MKQKFILIFIICINIIQAQQIFNIGVNLSQWFEETNAEKIHFTKFSKEDIKNIKLLGCDVIRLPINLKGMSSGEPDYNLSPLFLNLINKVIDWAEEEEMHLIIDNHTPQPKTGTPENINDELEKIWIQIAEEFKGRSEFIHYEILNEPREISDERWNLVLDEVIDAIRKIDTTHNIIVGPSLWNSFHRLDKLKIFDDEKIIYTFHFYDPFIFTHQGATWSDPSMLSLKDIPFPYSPNEMPTFPDDLIGTWVESTFNNYSSIGTLSSVYSLLDIADDFQKKNGVKLFCGEFGVYIPNSNNEDRVFWYEKVREYLVQKDISWTIWDYKGGFGLFEANSNSLFENDLNIPMIEALGLNLIEQTDFEILPENETVNIYDDFIGRQIVDISSVGDGFINYYSAENPADGDYCIHFNGFHQYGNMSLKFVPNKDLSQLKQENYFLSFYIKGDYPESAIDIRFVDSKKDSADRPWRLGFRLNGDKVDFNNQWQFVSVSLSELIELGSWDGEWFDPDGKFDWENIDRIEFVAEHHNLKGKNIWVDEIKISPEIVTSIDEKKELHSFRLQQNYPNPFNPATQIQFGIYETNFTRIIVFNNLGEKIKTIVEGEFTPGNYKVNFNAENLSSGIYYYQMISGGFIQTRKMLILK